MDKIAGVMWLNSNLDRSTQMATLYLRQPKTSAKVDNVFSRSNDAT